MTTPTPSPVEFDKAFQPLVNHCDPAEANALLPRRAHAVYTAPVILWMLACQRTHPDKSLEAAVQHLLATQPDLLLDNKRIREKHSRSTPAAIPMLANGSRSRPPNGSPDT